MSKITPEHLGRAAVVYVRQSTMAQVMGNLESQWGLWYWIVELQLELRSIATSSFRHAVSPSGSKKRMMHDVSESSLGNPARSRVRSGSRYLPPESPCSFWRRSLGRISKAAPHASSPA
jgi:hypothetical protein